MNLTSESPPACRFCGWLRAVSTGPVLAALITAYIVFAIAMMLAIGLLGGLETIPLDLRFWYEPSVVFATFDALGADGRYRYLVGTLTLDVVYPLIYSSMFAVWLSVLLPQDTRSACALRLLPFAILAADLLENSSIALLLAIYPQHLDILAWSATVFTASKWSLAVVVIANTLALTLKAAWAALARRLRSN